MRCASHAIMLSKITQQVLVETSILDGWHEAFHCQWNAAMTLIGFVMVYPDALLAIEARSAIDLAVDVFDNFGTKFSVAANAATITRDLCAKVDFLAKHNQSQRDPLNGDQTISMDDSMGISQGLSFDTSSSSYTNVLAPDLSLFDMAVDVDFWNNLDALWPEADNLFQFQSEI